MLILFITQTFKQFDHLILGQFMMIEPVACLYAMTVTHII